ncbi:MAG: 8-oxo-dGTP diphosphatase [Minisyncoccota bacterium]
MKTATVVIITQGDKILLGRKQGSPEIGAGTLNGPGGKMEPFDKTILDCVIRETEEELGIALDPAKIEKVAIITFYVAGEPYQEVHFYRTSSFSGEPHETDSMVPEWHDIDKVPFERMLESDPYWFPQLLHGEKFRTNVYYREKAKGFLDIDPFSPLTDPD